MNTIEEAIESAFRHDIEGLYKILSTSILAAKDSAQEISAAEQRFKKALESAMTIRNVARRSAGL